MLKRANFFKKNQQKEMKHKRFFFVFLITEIKILFSFISEKEKLSGLESRMASLENKLRLEMKKNKGIFWLRVLFIFLYF